MVFEGLFKKRTPFDTRGLEQFSPKQQEKILNRIGQKEASLIDLKVERETDLRLKQLEKDSGLFTEPQKKDFRSKLQGLKDFRQRNFERRARRLKEQKQKEEDFRAGRLAIKPIGRAPVPLQKKDPNLKIVMKEVKLKAPTKLL